MTLKEICKKLNVSRRAVQGYEKAGLVTAIGRNKYGHLIYDEEAERRIAQIRFYQQLGFSIKDITVLLTLSNMALKEVLEGQVQELWKEKIEIEELIKKTNRIIYKLHEAKDE